MNDITAIDESGLEDVLSEPSDATGSVLADLSGDIVVLGAGGKMGPTLTMMLRKASTNRNIYAVSRFSDKEARAGIERAGIKTVEIDLLDESQYSKLPRAENVFFLAGMKFGASGNQPLTWAMNCLVPALAARHYKDSKIVVFSTGNVYPLVDIDSGGATEDTDPSPIGEYAQSCLGRERMFEYFAQLYGTAVTLIRLNYANEPRYGIIVDLATKIDNGRSQSHLAERRQRLHHSRHNSRRITCRHPECHRAGNDSGSQAGRADWRRTRQETEIPLRRDRIRPAFECVPVRQHIWPAADGA
ncbi:MAG: NAD-dependent epimerase/dehydratase family protein [Planctomycetota bacterium]|jgi:hypothetical protein